MREARMVVSTAMHDRHLAVLVQALETDHRRVKSESVADLDDLALWNTQMGTRAVIRGVAVRHDGVQAVVAAGQFDDDEDALGVFLDARPLERLRGQRGAGAGDEHRQGGADADPIESARQEVASRTAARHSTPLLSNPSGTNRVGTPACSTPDRAILAAPAPVFRPGAARKSRGRPGESRPGRPDPSRRG